MLANAISLLQNNCSYLNSFIANNTKLLDRIPSNLTVPIDFDFCSYSTFDPPMLSRAIDAVSFTGLTGPISFLSDRSGRRLANLIVKQFDSNLNPVEIGLYTDGILVLNTSKLTFKNGKVPVSGKTIVLVILIPFL